MPSAIEDVVLSDVFPYNFLGLRSRFDFYSSISHHVKQHGCLSNHTHLSLHLKGLHVQELALSGVSVESRSDWVYNRFSFFVSAVLTSLNQFFDSVIRP